MAPITPRNIEIAKALRSRGYNWQKISQRLECDYDMIRRALDPEWAQKRRDSANRSRASQREKPARYHSTPIPAAVLAARNEAVNQSLTINQMILGDPPPGRSALDRRHGHA